MALHTPRHPSRPFSFLPKTPRLKLQQTLLVAPHRGRQTLQQQNRVGGACCDQKIVDHSWCDEGGFAIVGPATLTKNLKKKPTKLSIERPIRRSGLLFQTYHPPSVDHMVIVRRRPCVVWRCYRWRPHLENHLLAEARFLLTVQIEHMFHIVKFLCFRPGMYFPHNWRGQPYVCASSRNLVGGVPASSVQCCRENVLIDYLLLLSITKHKFGG